MTPAELVERVDRELSLTISRGVIVVIVAPESMWTEVERAREEIVARHELVGAQVVSCVARDCERSGRQITALNRSRDVLLREKRLIWVQVPSAKSVRELRRLAPDLTASIDLFAELSETSVTSSNWEECKEQLRALMIEQHRNLDFTGLLPANAAQRELPLVELYQPLVNPRRLSVDGELRGHLVLGHPGTGKTTYLRHLALTYATTDTDPLKLGAKIPLLVPLSDYSYYRKTERTARLFEYLPKWLADHEVVPPSSLSDHLHDVVLLLDGLDEMASLEGRRALLSEVGQLLLDGKVGGVVVTGRSFLVDELRAQDQGAFEITSPRAPSDDEVGAFLEAFTKLRGGTENDLRHLVQRINNDPDLSALAKTPLVLAFMAILDELEGRLPDRRIEIYYRLGEMLVDRWTKARGLGSRARSKDRPTRADAMRVLGPLAWWTVQTWGGTIPESALRDELIRIEKKRETAEEATRRADTLLTLLKSDTALLVPRGGMWRFVHSSIAEYFAAIEVERNKERWSALLADPFRAEWREITLFCAGQLGVIDGRTDSLDALVEAVLKRSTRGGRYDAKYPSLLIGLLRESPGLSHKQTTLLVERLNRYMFVTAFAPRAAWQIQLEWCALLAQSLGPTRRAMAEDLEEWLSPQCATEIRWDRVLRAGSPYAPYWSSHDTVQVEAMLYLGPLIALLGSASRRLDVDPSTTIAQWRTESDPRYRLAVWVAEATRKDLNRPFAEVARELSLAPTD